MKTVYVEVNEPLENDTIVSAGKYYYKVIDKIDSKTFIIEELATGETIRCIVC